MKLWISKYIYTSMVLMEILFLNNYYQFSIKKMGEKSQNYSNAQKISTRYVKVG